MLNKLIKVLKKLIKRAQRLAGIQIVSVTKDQFRWSHTVEDYYPISPKPRWQEGQVPYTHLYRAMDRNRVEYGTFLDIMHDNAGLIHGVDHEPKWLDRSAPFWSNDWFTALDAAALMNFIAWKRPTRYTEIGSGHSTRFVKYVIDSLKLDTRITSIDPVPRQIIDQICHRILRTPLESCDLSVFDELEAGDILFFDGSHRAFTNSDVVVFFFEVMPRLKPGVIVHIHDIFIPNDYPREFNGRLYNEQYIVAAMIMCGKPPFRILAPNAFICRDEFLSDRVKNIFASRTGAPDIPFVNVPAGAEPGTSFWVEMEGY